MIARRVYETIFIVNAALEDQDIESVISKVCNYIENNGGTVEEANKWGRRRLAYPINKKYNGFYVHLVYNANSSTVPVLERFLVLEDTILRHLTVQLPKKLREYRQRRALELGRPYESTFLDRPDDGDGDGQQHRGRGGRGGRQQRQPIEIIERPKQEPAEPANE